MKSKNKMKFNVRFHKSFLVFTLMGVIAVSQYGITFTRNKEYVLHELASQSPRYFDESILTKTNSSPDTEQIQELSMQVRTILAHNCTKCHGGDKAEGELRLDSKEFIDKGGKDGIIFVAGNPEQSELIRRIKLPRNDPDAMPATGDGLTKEDIAILEYWVKQG